MTLRSEMTVTDTAGPGKDRKSNVFVSHKYSTGSEWG